MGFSRRVLIGFGILFRVKLNQGIQVCFTTKPTKGAAKFHKGLGWNEGARVLTTSPLRPLRRHCALCGKNPWFRNFCQFLPQRPPRQPQSFTKVWGGTRAPSFCPHPLCALCADIAPFAVKNERPPIFGLKRIFTLGTSDYQNKGILYFPIISSFDTRVKPSLLLCAISNRSKGSR